MLAAGTTVVRRSKETVLVVVARCTWCTASIPSSRTEVTRVNKNNALGLLHLLLLLLLWREGDSCCCCCSCFLLMVFLLLVEGEDTGNSANDNEASSGNLFDCSWWGKSSSSSLVRAAGRSMIYRIFYNAPTDWAYCCSRHGYWIYDRYGWLEVSGPYLLPFMLTSGFRKWSSWQWNCCHVLLTKSRVIVITR